MWKISQATCAGTITFGPRPGSTYYSLCSFEGLIIVLKDVSIQKGKKESAVLIPVLIFRVVQN